MTLRTIACVGVVSVALLNGQSGTRGSQSWTGTLITADCSDMRYASAGEMQGLAAATPADASKGANPGPPPPVRRTDMATPTAPPGCEVTERTTAFGMITPGGKMVKVDSEGSARIAAELKSSGRLRKVDQKKQPLRVTVTGTMNAERVVVESVRF